eukprot:TRINITY_DN9407_c0_g1_i1.p1 TRINITY_DN9407_c0_g1~~TRINITY_DN9407_c0_g1_i1.p1  ORF type:complete len:303 (-),score=50.51 TRINITY_DN9407_c0_g1_i1:143-1051(-)
MLGAMSGEGEAQLDETYGAELVEHVSQQCKQLYSAKRREDQVSLEHEDCSVFTAKDPPGPKMLVRSVLPQDMENKSNDDGAVINWRAHSTLKYTALILTVLLGCFVVTLLVLFQEKRSQPLSPSAASNVEVSWKNYSIGVLTKQDHNTSCENIEDSFMSIVGTEDSVQAWQRPFASVTLSTGDWDSFFVQVTAHSDDSPYANELRPKAKSGDIRLTLLGIVQITDIDQGDSVEVCYDGIAACSDPNHVSTLPPTESPTVMPTLTPTPTPTEAPPTPTPTEVPTESPTQSPSGEQCSWYKWWC